MLIVAQNLILKINKVLGPSALAQFADDETLDCNVYADDGNVNGALFLARNCPGLFLEFTGEIQSCVFHCIFSFIS